ncbi:MAG: hypothetical protein NUV51_02940 [Sulfuricaulis sp.]|nr:hypothetical protein [Sulfuricaulis sp.]
MNKTSLIFVYNADSGFVNSLLDIGHKIVSPQTYSCNLCAITHSAFSMRDEWKKFVAGLGVSVEFLHRDELAQHYGLSGLKLPVILRKSEGKVSEWISRDEINHCQSLAELSHLVEKKLKT